ncbi:MAG: hypothetical protein IJ636_08470 [Bacteroidales bacterium]|nr:hypothetical protein [Bacteroidales bacterium]
MKKVLLIIIAVFSSLSWVFGQESYSLRRVEMSIGIGGAPALTKNDIGHGLWSAAIELKYSPVKWVSVGIMGGLYDWRESNYLSSASKQAEDTRKPSIKANAIVSVYGNWYTGRIVKVYSGFGIGTKNKESESSIPVGLEFVPFGIAVGKTVYGFFDCCFGTMATPARLGVGFRF